jgi:2',3'-cyclic-nucleotide 2'-phosphodiesterase/3'-nucleotidase
MGGGEFIKTMADTFPVHFISANIFFKNRDERFLEPFVILDVKANENSSRLPYKKIKMGIIGLTEPQDNMFSPRYEEDMLMAKEPVKVLRKTLPEVRKKADLVLLLYHGKYSFVHEISKTFPEIDIILMGGEYFKAISTRPDTSTIINASVSLGKYTNFVTLVLDRQKNILRHSKTKIPLKEDIQDDPKYIRLNEDYEKAAREMAARRQKLSRTR